MGENAALETKVRARGHVAMLPTKFLAVAVLLIGSAGLWSADSVRHPDPEIHVSWAFDVDDDRLVVGASQYVFFAEVLAAEPGPPVYALAEPATDAEDETYLPHPEGATFPRTLYTVNALADIKGSLSTLGGTHAVLQQGGVDVDGETFLMEDDTFLAVGSTYLLITRVAVGPFEVNCTTQLTACSVPSALALIAPGYDHERVDDAAEWAALEQRYSNAYANEVDPFSQTVE